ncbi:MAG: DNA repair protein RadA [Actinomycetota bacterium]|nr:DNA repair protein RadA [Actinomycetota bacterium]
MTRVRTAFRCGECGATAPKWAGRCPGCATWNSLVEEIDAGVAPGLSGPGPSGRPMPIAEVDSAAWAARPTGIGELDRVLGGGFVPGSVTLLGGEPGIGKSTLLLQVLAALAAGGMRCLLVCGEESNQQVRLRAERLGALRPRLWLVAETALPHVVAAIDEVAPDLVVIDSVQTLYDPALASAPGTVAQVRECAARLVRLAKERALPTVLVGHVTKDGTLAGPRVLEHVVDTVLSFEGERHHALRLLRAVKHRFGPTSELGLFEMADSGLVGVPDAGALFLADRCPGVPGSVVVPTLDGQRPLLVEVQGLVVSSDLAMPRRSAQGLEPGRLALLVAVLQQRAGLSLARADVFALAVGGVKVVEPAADLGVALALASARRGVAIAPDVVAVGEIGLGGELRQVGQLGRRLAEAARLGFTRAIVPASAPDPPSGITLERVPTLAGAIEAAGLGG